MSVARDSQALGALRALLDSAQPDRAYVGTAPLPPGFHSDWPKPWLWASPDAPAVMLPPLRSSAAYELADAAFIHASPQDSLTAPEQGFSAEQQRYCRGSIDVTMRGGTTSGVVYPLALCELARRFRLRNIGGASAGAIAAGLAAAAELGRMRWDKAGRPELPDLAAADRKQGHARQGYLGVADATAWFAQVDEGGLDEFRVAQLFRPTAAARPLWRIVVAAMRRNWVGLGLLLLWSFGWLSRSVTAVLLVGAPLLLSFRFGAGLIGDLATAFAGPYWWALFWLAALTVAGAGALAGVIGFGLWVRKPKALGGELKEPIAPPPHRGSPLGWILGLGALVVGVLALALLSPSGTWVRLGGWRVLAVWLLLIVALFGVQVVSLLLIAGRAKAQRFGLVSGSIPPTTQGLNVIGASLAGFVKPTVTDALIPWLSRLTSEIAGQDRVLRFGDLWLGDDYVLPGPTRPAAVLQRLRLAAGNSSARLVNLELMATELVHGVPWRFPLRLGDQRLSDGTPLLYFRRDDLLQAGAEMFPVDVVEALVDGTTAVDAYDVESGQAIDGLHPLPDPWDLPVVFATRMSLALPVLFQAVPLYRVAQTPDDPRHLVRDDYGARIQNAGGDIAYPNSAPGERFWVEELWLTDGGVTSNFPIHLFDAPLPLWPTVGINLGGHPNGHQHQDIWLPTDSQARTSPPAPQQGSLVGFLGAIVNTARGWADTSQTFMPAFRGRVAWVRQRSDEGGTNLFMTKQTIASLALRGAVAGARLAKRFGSDEHWERHQWLRLRVTLGNLSALRSSLGLALGSPAYSSLLADSGALTVDEIRQTLSRTGGDPNPAVPVPGEPDDALRWYDGDETWADGYWPAARAVTTTYPRSPPGTDPLTVGVPEPAPELRQVPPV